MSMESIRAIGDRFRTFRMDKGFSQSEVADGICSSSVISHLETGRSLPKPHLMRQLAERLRVPLREIMGMQESDLDIEFQMELVRAYLEMGDYEQAGDLIRSIEGLAGLLSHQQNTLQLFKAKAIDNMGRHDEAISILQPFLESQQTQQTVEDDTLCDAYNSLGTAHYKCRNFEKAFSAYEQGYRISLKLPDFGLIAARVTKNLGLTCHQIGFKEDASRYLEKAYFFYKHASDLKGLASTLFYLSLATGNEEHLTRARMLYESMNMVREANFAKQHYAFYIEANRNFPRALEELESSLVSFEQAQDFGMCVYISSRIAAICLDAGDLDQAEDYLALADAYQEKITQESEELLVNFYRTKALYFLLMKDYEQCVAVADKSSELCDKMGMLEESARASQIAAEAYHLQGHHELAFKRMKRAAENLQTTVQRRERA